MEQNMTSISDTILKVDFALKWVEF